MSIMVTVFLAAILFFTLYIYVKATLRDKFVNKETGVVYILKRVVQNPYGDTYVLQSTKDAKIINVLKEDLEIYFKPI